MLFLALVVGCVVLLSIRLFGPSPDGVTAVEVSGAREAPVEASARVADRPLLEQPERRPVGDRIGAEGQPAGEGSGPRGATARASTDVALSIDPRWGTIVAAAGTSSLAVDVERGIVRADGPGLVLVGVAYAADPIGGPGARREPQADLWLRGTLDTHVVVEEPELASLLLRSVDGAAPGATEVVDCALPFVAAGAGWPTVDRTDGDANAERGAANVPLANAARVEVVAWSSERCSEWKRVERSARLGRRDRRTGLQSVAATKLPKLPADAPVLRSAVSSSAVPSSAVPSSAIPGIELIPVDAIDVSVPVGGERRLPVHEGLEVIVASAGLAWVEPALPEVAGHTSPIDLPLGVADWAGRSSVLRPGRGADAPVVEIRTRWDTRIRGRLRLLDDAPFDGVDRSGYVDLAYVLVHDRDRSGTGARSLGKAIVHVARAELGPDGSFAIDGQAPGTYQLDALSYSTDRNRFRLAEIQFELPSTGEALDLGTIEWTDGIETAFEFVLEGPPNSGVVVPWPKGAHAPFSIVAQRPTPLGHGVRIQGVVPVDRTMTVVGLAAVDHGLSLDRIAPDPGADEAERALLGRVREPSTWTSFVPGEATPVAIRCTLTPLATTPLTVRFEPERATFWGGSVDVDLLDLDHGEVVSRFGQAIADGVAELTPIPDGRWLGVAWVERLGESGRANFARVVRAGPGEPIDVTLPPASQLSVAVADLAALGVDIESPRLELETADGEVITGPGKLSIQRFGRRHEGSNEFVFDGLPAGTVWRLEDTQRRVEVPRGGEALVLSDE